MLAGVPAPAGEQPGGGASAAVHASRCAGLRAAWG
jgi:hypothetical protein